mgnify:CR=1 FL=1|jgi:hypothetical protein
MRQVWSFEDWSTLEIKEAKTAFRKRSYGSPRLGELTVNDLCCLAAEERRSSPVGIYVFSRESEILYVGKTHGRSLHERAISHIDHRKPKKNSPHLAQFVTKLVKTGSASNESEAVTHILNMNMTWLPIPNPGLSGRDHKTLIAHIERRLLWKECLDPKFNSERVKKNSTFNLAGSKYTLESEMKLGDYSFLNPACNLSLPVVE